MKQKYKFMIDTVIMVLFVLMFNRHAVDLEFHEVVGLIAIALMIFHLILNWKWVVEISKRVFSKKIPGKVRAGYIVNLLLIVCLVVVFISSLLISRKVLTAIGFTPHPDWIPVHVFASAVMLILLGVHLGLHFTMIGQAVTKGHPVNRVIKIILYVLAAAAVVYGVYMLITGPFWSWLQSPFQGTAERLHAEGEELAEGLGKHVHGLGKLGQGKGLHGGEPFNITQFFSTLFGYVSVCLIFAFATAGISKIVTAAHGQKHRRRQV